MGAEGLVVAGMIILTVVTLGVMTSFELTAVFSTSLGALLALAVGLKIFGSPAEQVASGSAKPRLLQSSGEGVSARS